MPKHRFAPFGIGDPTIHYWVFSGNHQVGSFNGLRGAREVARALLGAVIKDRDGIEVPVQPCDQCGGQKTIRRPRADAVGGVVTCPTCNGRG